MRFVDASLRLLPARAGIALGLALLPLMLLSPPVAFADQAQHDAAVTDAEDAADADAREAERQAEAKARAELEAARAAFLERERLKQSERQSPVPVPDLGDTPPSLPPMPQARED